MILRRLYLYLVSAAALGVLAVGLVLLGANIVLFILHDPSADYSRGSLAIFSAMTLVALPVWAVHFGFAQRFAMRDPYERASALRRLYLYWACLFSSLAATVAIGFGVAQLLVPVLDGLQLSLVPAAQLGWATVVLAGIWAAHFLIARRDRSATPEEGTSATLRRWYMYTALLAGMLAMLAGTASLLQLAWTDLTLGTINGLLSGPAGLAIAGLVLWGVHARVIALRHSIDDRHSTLRALEGFIAVAICIAVALTGASQILYYLVARALGVDNPGNAGTNFVAAAAGPGSQLLVYGIAWFLISRRLTRDAATQEADRQAAIRRLYTNLASLISLAAMAIGAGWLLWNLVEQIEAPIIGVTAEDWKNPVSVSVTLLVVGGAVWLAHWRHAPWATDRQSLSRKLYVWAALLGSVLGVLAVEREVEDAHTAVAHGAVLAPGVDDELAAIARLHLRLHVIRRVVRTREAEGPGGCLGDDSGSLHSRGGRARTSLPALHARGHRRHRRRPPPGAVQPAAGGQLQADACRTGR